MYHEISNENRLRQNADHPQYKKLVLTVNIRNYNNHSEGAFLSGLHRQTLLNG